MNWDFYELLGKKVRMFVGRISPSICDELDRDLTSVRPVRYAWFRKC